MLKILEELDIQVATVNDVEVISIKDFARVIKMGVPTVHNFIYRGTIRNLKTMPFSGKQLVLVSEITAYPFKTTGRNSVLYFFKEDGTTTLEGVNE